MNAINFIQQRNIDEVREVLSMMPNFLVTHMTDDARMFIDANNPLLDEFQRSQIKDLICIDELKRLVESVDLVEKFGYDLDSAKQLLEFCKDCTSIELSGSVITVERLKQAIADYEAIGGEHV
nr:hypothetical protein [uncultured Acinetobacter sp.]